MIVKKVLLNFIMSVFSLLIVFVTLELVMKYYFIKTDGMNASLQSQRWFEKYWKPINSSGFRDYEPTLDSDSIHVLVVGDSFVTGHGIENIEDTFPHQLGSILGETFSVNISAQEGSTPNVEMVKNYPIKPDIVILSHFINDIENTLTGKGAKTIENLYTLPKELDFIINKSFLANFIYWRFISINSRMHKYGEEILGAYTSNINWKVHEELLSSIVNWTRENDIKMISITWPILTNIEKSKYSVRKVSDFFRSKRVDVVDMSEFLAKYPTKKITVNKWDSHPSKFAHKIAAEQLSQLISKKY